MHVFSFFFVCVKYFLSLIVNKFYLISSFFCKMKKKSKIRKSTFQFNLVKFIKVLSMTYDLFKQFD